MKKQKNNKDDIGAMGVNSFPDKKPNAIFDVELRLGKGAPVDWTMKPKKQKRFNAKKLKEKYKDLWLAIGRSVALDITDQQGIINSNKTKSYQDVGYLPLVFIENVAENAAFTAIVEMIKGGCCEK